MWRGGAIGLVLDQQARGRQFDQRPFHCYTATQSKSLTHVCESLRTKGHSYQLPDFKQKVLLFKKIRHLGTMAQICRAESSQLRHVSTIGEKLVKQQYVLHISSQYGELRPTGG